MDAKEARTLIAFMATAIPGVKIDAAQIRATAELWARLFARYDHALMERAALRVLESHEYNTLPAPAKLLDAANCLLTADEPDALSAWAEVQRAIDYVGRYAEREALTSMSPRTAYVVERMGWEGLCNTEIDASAVIRGQFCKLYDQCRRDTPDLRALPSNRVIATDREAHESLAAIERRLDPANRR